MFQGATKKVKDETIHTSIEKAYKDLSPQGFAVWVRLHVVPPEELTQGRGRIAKLIGYSEGRSNAILRELTLQGYLEQKSKGRFEATSFFLIRRCKITGVNAFVRLNSAFFPSSQEELEVIPAPAPKQSTRETIYFDCEEEVDEEESTNISWNGPSERELNSALGISPPKNVLKGKKSNGKPTEEKSQDASDESDDCKSLDDFYDSITGVRAKVNAKKTSSDDVENTTQNGKIPRRDHSQKTTPLELSKMRDFYKYVQPKEARDSDAKNDGGSNSSDTYIRERRVGKLNLEKIPSKEERRAKRVMNAESAPTHPDVGKPIDWNRFDLNDKPIISFAPDDSERATMIQLLSADHRRLSSKERTIREQIKNKLRQEFVRAYERYRKAVLREAGQRTTLYSVAPDEYRYAEKAAIACIEKGVTPKQVLQYWHENIRNFADKRMPVPPLPFLSSMANIDRVAIDLLSEARETTPAKAKERKGGERDFSRDAYGDVSLLHPRLRKILLSGGFDLSKTTDKQLVNIQAQAIDIAQDPESITFISREIREMVKYAAENVKEYTTNPMDYF